MTTYDTVLFDSDGVLVTPPAAETQATATRDAFAAMGVDDVDSGVIDELVAGVSPDRVRELCGRYDLEPDRFWTTWEDHDERSQFEQFRAGRRDCYDDLEAIDAIAQPCGVVSNNHHSTIEFVLEHFDLEPWFDRYYGRPKTLESLSLQKPNTHYLERALADFEATNALYIGDSEHDVTAAHDAGMDSAFVRRPHTADVSLAVEPTYDVDGLLEVASIVAE
ncbi:HAD family hydrolase [Natrialbaceae archaeon A-CW1-1]